MRKLTFLFSLILIFSLTACEKVQTPTTTTQNLVSVSEKNIYPRTSTDGPIMAGPNGVFSIRLTYQNEPLFYVTPETRRPEEIFPGVFSFEKHDLVDWKYCQYNHCVDSGPASIRLVRFPNEFQNYTPVSDGAPFLKLTPEEQAARFAPLKRLYQQRNLDGLENVIAVLNVGQLFSQYYPYDPTGAKKYFANYVENANGSWRGISFYENDTAMYPHFDPVYKAALINPSLNAVISLQLPAQGLQEFLPFYNGGVASTGNLSEAIVDQKIKAGLAILNNPDNFPKGDLAKFDREMREIIKSLKIEEELLDS